MSPACGTKSGYQKHTRAGEQPCAQCTEANRDYMREYRKHNNRGRRARTEHILTDLIAELRSEHWTKVWAVPPDTGDNWCQGCGEYQPCPSLQIADRAEARLREVQGE